MPDRWLKLWPVTYYIMGAYLSDYPPRMPSWLMGLLFAAVTLLDGLLWYCMADGGIHRWSPFSDWGGLGVTAAVFLLFSLLRRVRLNSAPRAARRMLELVSKVSLAAYLVSWIPDQLIYGILNRIAAPMPARLVYIPVAVPAVVLGALLLALPVDWSARKIQLCMYEHRERKQAAPPDSLEK